jgi:pimeloyl-ACP methyl ester carboxylesterase
MRNVFRYANNSVIPSKRPAPDLAPARGEDLYVDIGGARLRYRDEGEGPALLGTSQGARVALHVASVSPGMISCLILDGSPRIGAATNRRDPQELPYEDFRHLAQTQGMTSLRREWMRHPLAELKTGGPEARELLARMVARYPGKDLVDPVARPTLTTTAEMIQSIAPPVLVIGGRSTSTAAGELPRNSSASFRMPSAPRFPMRVICAISTIRKHIRPPCGVSWNTMRSRKIITEG